MIKLFPPVKITLHGQNQFLMPDTTRLKRLSVLKACVILDIIFENGQQTLGKFGGNGNNEEDLEATENCLENLEAAEIFFTNP